MRIHISGIFATIHANIIHIWIHKNINESESGSRSGYKSINSDVDLDFAIPIQRYLGQHPNNLYS